MMQLIIIAALIAKADWLKHHLDMVRVGGSTNCEQQFGRGAKATKPA